MLWRRSRSSSWTTSRGAASSPRPSATSWPPRSRRAAASPSLAPQPAATEPSMSQAARSVDPAPQQSKTWPTPCCATGAALQGASPDPANLAGVSSPQGAQPPDKSPVAGREPSPCAAGSRQAAHSTLRSRGPPAGRRPSDPDPHSSTGWLEPHVGPPLQEVACSCIGPLKKARLILPVKPLLLQAWVGIDGGDEPLLCPAGTDRS